MAAEYLIWSIEHDAWWRPGRMGYTKTLREAGRYTFLEGLQVLQRANVVKVNECLIPLEALGLGADPDPAPPRSEQLGDLLQWVGGTDPAYLRELEAQVRAHVDLLLRR